MAVESVGVIEPVKQYVDASGIPYAGGSLTFLVPSTNTAQSVYSDAALTVSLGNVVTLNAAGRTSTSAVGPDTPVYCQQLPYDYILKDANGITVWGPITFAGSQWPGQVQGQAVINPAANANAYANRFTTTLNKAISGVHALFAGTRFDIPTIGAGASTLTEASTVYIEGPPAAGTNKYPLHVAAGMAAFDGGISSGGVPITFPSTDGQLLIGDTAINGPLTNTLTGSQGITIMNGSGTITIVGNELDKVTTEQNVVNTASVTSVYSKSIAGGTLGTTGILMFVMSGEYSNTSGGSSTFSVTGTYGGTNFCSGSLTNFSTASTGGFELVALINANAATNSQRAVAKVNMVPSGSAPGSAVFTSSGLVNVAYNATMAEDSTVAKTFSVSVTHGTADPNIFFKAWTRALFIL